jgi:hypothetical protein
MKIVEVVFIVGIFAVCAWLVVVGIRALVARVSAHRRVSAPWKANSHPLPDGSTAVVVERPGERRVVAELPPHMNPVDRTSELMIALADAELEADTMNKGRR